MGKTFSDKSIGRIREVVRRVEGDPYDNTSNKRNRRQSAGAGKPFSGVAYIGGEKIINLKSNSSKPWVFIDIILRTAVEDIGPPPSPFEPRTTWREKAQVSGDIYVDAFG